MSGNIIQNRREIGVLRSIGMKKKEITMLYVYEAFVLVFASSLFGILIGTTVSWTMTMQEILFTGLPIPFQFPFSNFYTSFLVAIVCAFLSSYTTVKVL